MIRPIGTHAGDEALPRRGGPYWCVQGHHTPRRWSADATASELWESRGGLPAVRNRARPFEPVTWRPFESLLAHVLERRCEAEWEALLDGGLQSLRTSRCRPVRGLRT